MQAQVFLLTALASFAGAAAAAGVSFSEYDDYVLTHELTPFGPLPTAQDPNGVYPYVSYAETSRRPSLKKYRFVVLENPQLKVTVSPDLGGKVISMIHKAFGSGSALCARCDPPDAHPAPLLLRGGRNRSELSHFAFTEPERDDPL